MERLSGKNAYLCIVIPEKGGDDIEESDDALTRQRTWKVTEYGREVEGCSSCRSIYGLLPRGAELYIFAGVSRFPFLRIRVFQDLLTENVEKAHTLCAYA